MLFFNVTVLPVFDRPFNFDHQIAFIILASTQTNKRTNPNKQTNTPKNKQTKLFLTIDLNLLNGGVSTANNNQQRVKDRRWRRYWDGDNSVDMEMIRLYVNFRRRISVLNFLAT